MLILKQLDTPPRQDIKTSATPGGSLAAASPNTCRGQQLLPLFHLEFLTRLASISGRGSGRVQWLDVLPLSLPLPSRGERFGFPFLAESPGSLIGPPFRQPPRLRLLAFAIPLLLTILGARVGLCSNPDRPPNFIVIFTDDQGYGELGCFGGSHVQTPRIDRMATEGIRLRSFYAAAPYCTASRAALMTGCYPRRVGLEVGSTFPVLLAADAHGLNPDEITLAEVLKKQGYATGCFGKWHLGDQPQFLPTRQGFDVFYGIPYSHDIHPHHPAQGKRFHFPPLPLLESERVIELDPDADNFTKNITERAVQFVTENKDRPFFVYLPHPIPHLPYHVSDDFKEGLTSEQLATLRDAPLSDYQSRLFLRPHCIREIDWSVGRLLDTLQELHLADNTIVFFTTDNGGATNAGGNNGPLRAGKGSCYEGGMRVPAVAWAPGRIKPGTTSDELVTAMDLLPTVAKLAGGSPPADRTIDGRDVWPILSGAANAKSPHEAFVYYDASRRIKAIRSGPWKLVFGNPRELYHLDRDLGEKQNVAADHPEVVTRLAKLAQRSREELGEGSRLGPGCRPIGKAENPRPLSMSSAR